MHRRIYKSTVAGRIAMRRLCRATERATMKSIKKAAKSQKSADKTALKAAKSAAKAQKSAEKAALKSAQKAAKKLTQSSHSAPLPAQAPQTAQPAQILHSPEETSAESQPTPVHNLTLHQLRTDLEAAVDPVITAKSYGPKVEYISSVLQEFREGVKVQILHTKARISIDNPLATTMPQTVSEKARGVGSQSSLEFLATNDTLKTGRLGFSGERAEPTSGLFRRRPTRAELINAESCLGRTLFGPIPAGHRREFFHDRGNVWIWYEGWTEPGREPHQITIRYEVRPTGVYKKLAAGNYVELAGGELENFRRAAHAYLYLIKRNLYHLA